jgi:hypothetical protein
MSTELFNVGGGMTPLTVLIRARERIGEGPNRWCRKYEALALGKRQVSPHNADATSWCMMGIVQKCSGVGNEDLTGASLNILGKVIRRRVPVANDALDTTYQMVLGWFDAAIAWAKKIYRAADSEE